MATFTLKIIMGNEAMLTGRDLAEQLVRIANALEPRTEAGLERGLDSGIWDRNGNRVGKWEVKP